MSLDITLGKIKLTVSGLSAEKIFTKFLTSGVPFYHFKDNGDSITLYIDYRSKKKVIKLLDGIEYKSEFTGLLRILYLYRKRTGLVTGAVIFAILIYLSSLFVWQIRVFGNKSVTDREIISLLSKCGFYEGILKKGNNLSGIENDFLRRTSDVVYISINIHGMVADVIVHERLPENHGTDINTPYNLVSDADGIVLSTMIYRGMKVVNKGDTIIKGQLLVSGFVDFANGECKITSADGRIFAKTYRSKKIEIPLSYYEKKYINEEEITAFRILGKKFGQDSYEKKLNFSSDYDILYSEEGVEILGKPIPVTVMKTLIAYYSNEKCEISEEEALKKAYDEYYLWADSEIGKENIQSENFSHEIKDNILVLSCDITSIENVAVRQKIETEGK